MLKDQDKYLKSSTSWQERAKPTGSSVGQILDAYLGQRAKEFERKSELVDIWQAILPEQLKGRASLGQLSGGVLNVYVQPGAYMHIMQMHSNDLIEMIGRNCPWLGVKKIRLHPAGKEDKEIKS